MSSLELAPTACETEFADERLVGDWAAALPAMLAETQIPPWCSYAARIGGQVVGYGGFKGKPDDTGRVEISYLTLSPERGRGVATTICSALVEIAFANGAMAVLGHTQPSENASTGVLRRQKFEFAGEWNDPEDGFVWRWVRLAQ